MWDLISSVIQRIWNNPVIRYLLLGVLVIIALVIGFNKITNTYYEKGIDYQTQVYEQEQNQLKEEYQKRLDAANTDRVSTNAELAKLKNDYATLQLQRQEKQTTTIKERAEYAQSDNGKLSCINGKWLQLYKNSLPD